jgi:Flp pilus assembly protein TadG
MRMTPSQATRPNSDRGVASVIFVLFLSAALGLAALVVDVGNAWQERRHLVTATDAASLAAVQDYVQNDPGCTLSAPGSVTANNPAATMTSCVHVPPAAGSPGRVTVEAEATVDFFFAGVFGVNSKTVSSSTTASYDTASAVTGGLRPFGLCIDSIDALIPDVVPGDGVVYRISYGKDDQPDSCGGEDVPGNWGILDFDGGANRQNDIKDWTLNGYPGTVTIGDDIEGDTGAYSNSLNSELNFLMTVESFGLPVFDVATGNGANAEFHIVNFAAARLDGFKTTGPQADRYFDIEFLDEVVQGTGGGPAVGFGAYVIGICAVNGVNPTTACT